MAAQLEDTDTHTGAPFLGVEAAGRSVRTLPLARYAWRDRPIAEVRSVTDRLQVRQQLGDDVTG